MVVAWVRVIMLLLHGLLLLRRSLIHLIGMASTAAAPAPWKIRHFLPQLLFARFRSREWRKNILINDKKFLDQINTFIRTNLLIVVRREL